MEKKRVGSHKTKYYRKDLFDIINQDKTINKYLIGNKLKEKFMLKIN